MNKKKIFMIVSICILILTIIGSTVAFFGWRANDALVNVTVSSGTGVCDRISDNNILLEPTTSRDNGRIVKLSAKQQMSNKAYITWNMEVNNIAELQHESFLYELVNTTTGVSYGSGSFKHITNEENSNTIIFGNSEEKLDYNVEYEFTLYLWIDGVNFNNPYTMGGEDFDFDISCTITGIGKDAALPIMAEKDTWYTQGGTEVKRSTITEIELMSYYRPEGEVTDFWDASAAKDGSVMAYVEGTKLTLSGNGSGNIYLNENARGTFSDINYIDYYTNLTVILGIGILNTSNSTNMQEMFLQCSKLTQLDLSNFDTSKVTNMISMFNTCSNLIEIDTKLFDTKNVEDMHAMFMNCINLSKIDVSGFNTSKVKNMKVMFYYCKSLETIAVDNWDTSSVTDMQTMFLLCESLIELNLEGWNTANVTNMNGMFSGCSKLKELKLNNWYTSKVIDMHGMFAGCTNLEILKISNFNTSIVENMSSMFENCYKLTELNLNNFNTSSVTTMEKMFKNCYQLINLTISNFNTQKVKSMGEMFLNCSNIETLNLSHFDTSNVTTMWSMFNGCVKLQTLDVSNFDMSNVTDSSYMFGWNKTIKTINFRNADFTGIETYQDMFANIANSVNVIVKDTTQQKWLTDNFSNLTNVTVYSA